MPNLPIRFDEKSVKIGCDQACSVASITSQGYPNGIMRAHVSIVTGIKECLARMQIGVPEPDRERGLLLRWCYWASWSFIFFNSARPKSV